MSPSPSAERTGAGGFPRVSGDEPIIVSNADNTGKFSPRERG